MNYTLYKTPISKDNKGCELTQNIVRYIHHTYAVDIQPRFIIEHNYPTIIEDKLPSLRDNNNNIYYIGKDAVLKFFEMVSNIPAGTLESIATDFGKNNPIYRMNL